ncbi:MAG: AEC family transporter [Puniceicoccaceae bacterium]
MLQTFQTLFPVFAIIGLGYLLAMKGFLAKPFLDDLNKLVYWVCLPSLIINNLDRAENITGDSLTIILIYLGATLLVMVVARLVAFTLGLEGWQHGTFIQGSFRGNLAFIGLPILIYALRDLPSGEQSRIVAQAIFVFAPIMIFYNIASVLVLSKGRNSNTESSPGRSILRVATNPLILAAVSGLCLYLLPLDLPVIFGDTLQFIGRTAAPMALICVGGGMALTSMEGRYRSATYAACLKVFATPLLAWLISLPFDFSHTDTLILMIFAATPTAVASYVMAKQMDGDAAMASGAIILSTLFSLISLSVVVGIF